VRRCELVGEPVGLGPHDHVAWAHEGTADFRRGLVAFLDEGLAGDEQLLYYAPREQSEMLDDVAGLAQSSGLLESGRLRIVPVTRRTSDFTRLETARMMQGLRDRVADALSRGFHGLRMASEVTPTFTSAEDSAAQLRLECVVDQITARLPLVALCAVDGSSVVGPPEQALFAMHHLRGGLAGVDAPWLSAIDDDTWLLRGQVDLVNRHGFATALAALPSAMSGTALHLWVDQLEFIDVAGLRALVGLAHSMSDHGRVVLHSPPSWLSKMIRLAFGDVRGLELVGGEGWIPGCAR